MVIYIYTWAISASNTEGKVRLSIFSGYITLAYSRVDIVHNTQRTIVTPFVHHDKHVINSRTFLGVDGAAHVLRYINQVSASTWCHMAWRIVKGTWARATRTDCVHSCSLASVQNCVRCHLWPMGGFNFVVIEVTRGEQVNFCWKKNKSYQIGRNKLRKLNILEKFP